MRRLREPQSPLALPDLVEKGGLVGRTEPRHLVELRRTGHQHRGHRRRMAGSTTRQTREQLENDRHPHAPARKGKGTISDFTLDDFTRPPCEGVRAAFVGRCGIARATTTGHVGQDEQEGIAERGRQRRPSVARSLYAVQDHHRKTIGIPYTSNVHCLRAPR